MNTSFGNGWQMEACCIWLCKIVLSCHCALIKVIWIHLKQDRLRNVENEICTYVKILYWFKVLSSTLSVSKCRILLLFSELKAWSVYWCWKFRDFLSSTREFVLSTTFHKISVNKRSWKFTPAKLYFCPTRC